MAFSRFSLYLTLRLFIIFFVIFVFGFFLNKPKYLFLPILLGIIALLLIYELWFFLNTTNREVARFFAAVRYADFNQSFDFSGFGGEFKNVGESFSQILEKLKRERTDQEVENQSLKAMMENVPVALISIDGNHQLKLLNNAARKLFARIDFSELEGFQKPNENFFQTLKTAAVGEKVLATVRIGDLQHQLSINITEISTAAGSTRLISLQDIGRELELTQLNSWQDLVRVLTHEIMNSITPVASLAQTTADMAQDAIGKLSTKTLQRVDLEKIENAATTLSNRSNRLMEFVSNYRQLTRLPKPEKQPVKVRALFQDLERIFSNENSGNSTQVIFNTEHPEMVLEIDRQQIEQVLINLIKNAEQALTGSEHGKITVSAVINAQSRATIEVHDNGPGIEEKIQDKIFLPYFTTKSDGSGIGLALARQIVILHGGSINFENLKAGGARFNITF